MKFFIDSANIEDIKKAVMLGICDGVTTNPTLLAKEEGEAEEIYRAISETVDGPVNAETISEDAQGIIREGRELAAIHPNIVVKIPCTTEGLVAVKQLESENIRTNVTLVFSPMQALLAAKAGASFVCPFVGRLDDTGHDGMELIEQILTIFENYGFTTEIIVASIRGVQHVLASALIGAHIATIPFNIIAKLAGHPLTDAGIAAFLNDWNQNKSRT